MPLSPEPSIEPSSQRRYEVILNREAGTLRELWHDHLPEDLVQAFAEAGVEARINPAAPPDLDTALDAAISSKPDAIIIGGGDGTVSNAARKLADTGIPMGILPFGTFNLAARDLGIPLEVLDAARALATATPTDIDMLAVGERACLCTALIGFYPALAKREEEFHGQAWWKKSFRILHQTFDAWKNTRPLDLEIKSAEGNHLQRRTRFAAFVPGEYDDIFSVIPKRIDPSSGEMTLYVSRHRTLWQVTTGILAYLLGFLNTDKDVERLSTTGVSLKVRKMKSLSVMIDGEIVEMPLPLDIQLRPGAIVALKPREEDT